MKNLDKNSPIPLYFQMAELIKNKIENNEWKINKIVPSELKLCEDFQISRGTVRQAINYLIQEGYLYRRQGLGTFACKPSHVLSVSSFYCVEFDGKSQQKRLKRKILSKKIIIPNYRVKKIMALKSNQELYQIKGLLLLDSIPIAMESFYLLKELFPNLHSKDLSTMAPYEVFMRKYNLKISEVRESFSIKKLDKKTADKLGLLGGANALLVNRLAYLDNTIFEYRQSIIRTDKCHYTVRLM
jgi:GntR family transcriptional regulator